MSDRELDIGLASYGNPEGLANTYAKLVATARTNWRLYIVNNLYPDPGIQAETVRVLEHIAQHPRVQVAYRPDNIGYAGAVNQILNQATTEYIAYCDHDLYFQTDGWDEEMAFLLDRFHELGIVMPMGGAAPIPRGEYWEILWGVGSCWMTTRMAAMKAWQAGPEPGGYKDTRPQFFDENIGHQEEVDFQTRLRLAGFKIGAHPNVHVAHMAKATNDPANIERIGQGVVNWVNKWCRYFGGARLNYHSDNVLRHEDWPTSALHMEQYFKLHLGEDFNAHPNTVIVNHTEYDVIRVPRLKGFYRTRII